MAKTRNKLEANEASRLGSEWKYEEVKLKYTLPDKTYLADFADPETKTIRETKGYFPPVDRAKMKAVAKSNPDWTIVMVFQDPDKKISKTSKTSYAEWCEANGLKWEKAVMPEKVKKVKK